MGGAECSALVHQPRPTVRLLMRLLGRLLKDPSFGRPQPASARVGENLDVMAYISGFVDAATVSLVAFTACFVPLPHPDLRFQLSRLGAACKEYYTLLNSEREWATRCVRSSHKRFCVENVSLLLIILPAFQLTL